MGINGLLQLLIGLCIFALVAYVVLWVIGQLSLPPIVRTIVLVIVAIIVLLWLLRTFAPGLVF